MNSFVKAIDLYFHDLMALSEIDYGDKNYSKYIILGRSRVGTNMLRSILNRHNSIISYGELFRNVGEVGWGLRYYWDNKVNLFGEDIFLQNRPIEFLDKRIYKNYRKNISAVGFKLFYYHARNDNWLKIWDYLYQNGVNIIHLKRKNLLRVHLSRQLAEKTGGWTNKTYNELIRLDPEQCKNDFERTLRWWDEAKTFFDKQQMLELWYEDLVSNQDYWIQEILRFLDVKNSNSTLVPKTKKQASKNSKEMIKNYAELKNYFMGTRWEYLFD